MRVAMMAAWALVAWVGLAGEEKAAAPDKEKPLAAVEQWIGLLEKGEFAKYIEAALEADKIPDKAKMVEVVKAQKDFFLAVLKAMRDGAVLSVLDDGTNRVASFTFAKETNGYYAVSLKWDGKRWHVFNMYRPGQPIKSHAP
jgi:hypothetical protein